MLRVAWYRFRVDVRAQVGWLPRDRVVDRIGGRSCAGRGRGGAAYAVVVPCVSGAHSCVGLVDRERDL